MTPLTNKQRLKLWDMIRQQEESNRPAGRFRTRLNPGGYPNAREVWCDHPTDDEIVMRYGLNDDGSVWDLHMQEDVDATLKQAVLVANN